MGSLVSGARFGTELPITATYSARVHRQSRAEPGPTAPGTGEPPWGQGLAKEELEDLSEYPQKATCSLTW